MRDIKSFLSSAAIILPVLTQSVRAETYLIDRHTGLKTEPYQNKNLAFNNGSTSKLKSADWSSIIQDFVVGIGTPSGSGSGVIIGRKGNTYTLLTAKHVIASFNKNDSYEIYSPKTKKYYDVIGVSYPPNKGLDIMMVQFKSNDQLTIAVINEFYKNPFVLQQSNVSKAWKVAIDGVRGGGISMPTKAVTIPIFRFIEAALLERAVGNRNGYEFLYQASTVPGMSGGPLVGWRAVNCGNSNFPPQGYFSLLAIHGRSEGYDQGGGRSGISLGVPIDLISEYLKINSKKFGIPVSPSETEKVAVQNYC